MGFQGQRILYFTATMYTITVEKPFVWRCGPVAAFANITSRGVYARCLRNIFGVGDASICVTVVVDMDTLRQWIWFVMFTSFGALSLQTREKSSRARSKRGEPRCAP